MALALASLAPNSFTSFSETTAFSLNNLSVFLYSSSASRASAHLGVPLCLVKNWQDLEHHIALLDRLALPDQDLLEIPAVQGTDVDVTLRVDLADTSLGDDDVLCQRAADHNLAVLLVGLLLGLFLVKIRLNVANNVFLYLIGTRANIIKIGVNLRMCSEAERHRPATSITPGRPHLQARRPARMI